VDWSTGFQGWSDPSIAQYGGSITSPEGLVTAFFETLEENALALSNGQERLGPGGEPLPVHVTASGLDLVQLTQKFLGGAIAFHQGADDYLDDDSDGKGILSPNARVAESPYSPLEHAWDEGFGYFGAARDYAAYTDDELAAKGGREGWAKGYHDSDGDGAIDLLSEYNFAASVNAASRDRGSKEGAKTDFTQQAIEGFVLGRALIHNAGDTLTEAELTQLRAFRDQAIGGWEGAIAATVVHYINDTLREMAKFDADGYDFLNHAKVWGEMKGFALWFQFNPRSPLSKEDFGRLHGLLGDAPVLATASPEEIAQYQADLREARALIATAFGFDAANLGDDQGEGGW
jgi:hypothetical protein